MLPPLIASLTKNWLVAAVDTPKKMVKPDIMARLKEIWGDRVLSEDEVEELRDLELEDHDG